MTSEAEKKARAMMGGDTFEASEAGQAYLAEKAEAFRVRGLPHGLSPAQVEAADTLDMSLDKYKAYTSVRTFADREDAERKLAADEAAQVEAERQLAVERAKKALG